MTENAEPSDNKVSPGQAPLPSPIHPVFMWWFSRAIYRGLIAVWHRYKLAGHSNLPETGGALLLSNHQSYLDPMMVGVGMKRPVSFVARDTLFKIPIVGPFLRRVYVLPVKRGAVTSATIRESVRRIEHGFFLGLFPEGTRAADGQVGRFKSGFLSILKRTEVPVIPVGVAGTYAAMPKGAIFVRPKKVVVYIGKPIPFAEMNSYLAQDQEKELVEMIRQRVIECQREAEAIRTGIPISSGENEVDSLQSDSESNS